MVKFVLHFAFLVVGIAYLVRRSERFYWRRRRLLAGIVANAAYGIVQLGSARAGINLDQSLLSPITGGASQINIYGAIDGENVFRPNALTGDPNHLGIELVIPLLVLTPLYLRLEKGHRLKVPLALVLAFLLLVELATLSRRGLLGLGAGLLVLVVPYRRKLLTPRVPAAARRGARPSSRSSWRRAGTSSSRSCGRASTRRRTGRRRTSTSTASSRTCSRRTRSSGWG